ncbi:MAG TPA: methyltransferase domain-containing protein [Patescibacteria group bacterium]|nr:methyltransferase domain-containing protein [Patescibacteria group bacterium]
MPDFFLSAAIALVLLFELLLIVFLLFLLSLLFLAVWKVPWVPTPRKMGCRMFHLAGLKKGERVVDFGCGDGSLLLTAAKEFGATGIGFEIHPGLRLLARLRARLAGVSSMLEFRGGDFFHARFPEADVVACYLFSEVQERLEPLLCKAYPAGTRVISRTFRYPTLPLITSEKVGSETFYLYRISEKQDAHPLQ